MILVIKKNQKNTVKSVEHRKGLLAADENKQTLCQKSHWLCFYFG